jgi:hypothetical protein
MLARASSALFTQGLKSQLNAACIKAFAAASAVACSSKVTKANSPVGSGRLVGLLKA